MYGMKAAIRLGLRVGCVLVLGWLSVASVLQAQPKIRFPLPRQTFYPDRLLRLEWSSTAQKSVDVLYSQDEGHRWTRIAAGMNDSAFEWMLPLLDTTGIIFKVQEADLHKPQEFQRIIRTAGCISARWDANDHFIVSAMDNAMLEVRSSDNMMAIASLPLGTMPLVPATSYTLHPDTAITAIGNEIVLENVEAFSEPVRFGADVHQSYVRCLAVHPLQGIVAAGTEEGKVYVWSIPERRMISSFASVQKSPINTVAFSADGQKILYAGDEGIIFVRSWTDALATTMELRGHGDGGKNVSVRCAAFTPDGRHVVSGGVDYTVRYWDLRYQSSSLVMFGHRGAVTGLKISADGTRVLSASADSTVRQWSLSAGREMHEALQLNDEVASVDYSLGADTLLAAERHSGTLVLWQNLRETGDADSVIGYITYPIALRVCNTKAQVGEYARIPVVFDSVVSVPFFKRARFHATVGLTLPRRIVEVQDVDPNTIVLHGDERDTIFLPIEFSQNDTVGYIPVRFLLSEENSDDIEILPGRSAIQWMDGVRAFSLDHATGGTVSSEKECPQTARGGLSMMAVEQCMIAPNPSNDRALLEFSTYEEGDYQIDVLSPLGDAVLTLSRQRMSRGRQQMSIPSNELSSGAYFLRIGAPSGLHIYPFVVVH